MQISTLLRFSKAIWPRFPMRCSHCISECSALPSEISIHLIRVLNVLSAWDAKNWHQFSKSLPVFLADLSSGVWWHADAAIYIHLQLSDLKSNRILNWVNEKFFNKWCPVFKKWTSLGKKSWSFGLMLILGLQKFALGKHQNDYQHSSCIKFKNLITMVFLLSICLARIIMEKSYFILTLEKCK